MTSNNIPEINVERIKQYNNNLRILKDKQSALKAEHDYLNRELNKQLEEISIALGTEVNRENIEIHYKEIMEKIQDKLTTGEEIMQRIEDEEQRTIKSRQEINNTGIGEFSERIQNNNIQDKRNNIINI